MTARDLSLAVFLLLVVLAAAISSQFEAGTWYYMMNRPAWTPPAWLFGVAGALVYLLMALAAWNVWDTGHYARMGALTWWLIVLALTVIWSWLFFGLERSGWAMGELAISIGVLIMCMRAFSLLSRPAALMLLPGLAWLLFTWFLNFSIWSMNGGGLGSML